MTETETEEGDTHTECVTETDSSENGDTHPVTSTLSIKKRNDVTHTLSQTHTLSKKEMTAHHLEAGVGKRGHTDLFRRFFFSRTFF